MLLRERLGLDKATPAAPSTPSCKVRPGQDITKSEKEMCNILAKASVTTPPTPSTPAACDSSSTSTSSGGVMSDRERYLVTKYLALIQCRRNRKDLSLTALTPADSRTDPLSPQATGGLPSPNQESAASGGFVPCFPCGGGGDSTAPPSSASTPAAVTTPGSMAPPVMYVADIEEVRLSPVVSRRGMLSVLEKGALGWVRRWVVVRRPYVLLFKDERDSVERALINLAAANVQYSEDQEAVNGMPHAFRSFISAFFNS